MSKSSSEKTLGENMRVVGLMSGTSMDGIDAALVETDGEADVRTLAFASVAYDEPFRERLRQALQDAAGMTARDERPGCLARVERELTERHAAAVADLLSSQGISASSVDLISFHGQTVLHRPQQRLTVQIGDGALLAQMTGIDVVYDLRAADVAAGGQGAPLAPAYHRAMGQRFGQQATAIVNIGGVANVTFVGGDGSLMAFDTGPGNALIDDWVYARTGNAFDDGGRYSNVGKVDTGLLVGLMSHSYFRMPPPKSLDRNQFEAGGLGHLSVEDGAATLAAFTVEAIARAADFAWGEPVRWIVCGGGRCNPSLMEGLRARLAGSVLTAEEAGFNGDAIEAEAWAYLGVRSVKGLALTFPGTTGVEGALTGGVVASAAGRRG